MFRWPAQPHQPGLFVTGTDTGVGKTAITCGIVELLRERAKRADSSSAAARGPGVCKPFATGCRRGRSGWTGEDIEALGFAGGVDLADEAARERLCPQAFELPASPAAAADHEQRSVDYKAVARALLALDAGHDRVVVEGIGGPKVPLDPKRPRYSVAEFAADLGFPVLVVARAGLGTLSHTAMSVESLQTAGCRVVGIVLNDGDDAAENDPTVPSNPTWIERSTGVKVLARVPRLRDLVPGQPSPPTLLDRLRGVAWHELSAPAPWLSEATVW